MLSNSIAFHYWKYVNVTLKKKKLLEKDMVTLCTPLMQYPHNTILT